MTLSSIGPRRSPYKTAFCQSQMVSSHSSNAIVSGCPCCATEEHDRHIVHSTAHPQCTSPLHMRVGTAATQTDTITSSFITVGVAYRVQQALQTCCLARCHPLESCLSHFTITTTQRFRACQIWICAPGLAEPTGRPGRQLCSREWARACCHAVCCAGCAML